MKKNRLFASFVCITAFAFANAQTWNSLGSGINGTVYSMAVFNNELYAGGFFTVAGGSPGDYIAKWDGAGWSQVGGGMDERVYALTVFNNELYAGGHFKKAGSNAAKYVAKWNGSAWTAVGSNVDSTVFALTVYNSSLYAGGNLTISTVQGGSHHVAKWDGSAWAALVGNHMNVFGTVFALESYNGELVVGGDFSTNYVSTTGIIKWHENTLTWTPLASGLTNGVRALEVHNSVLYAGGNSQQRA